MKVQDVRVNHHAAAIAFADLIIRVMQFTHISEELGKCIKIWRCF